MAFIYGRIVEFLLGAAFDDILTNVSLAVEELLLTILPLGAGIAASIQKRTVAVGKLFAAVAQAIVELASAGSQRIALVGQSVQETSFTGHPIYTLISGLIQEIRWTSSQWFAKVGTPIEKLIGWAGNKCIAFKCIAIEELVVTTVFDLLTFIRTTVQYSLFVVTFLEMFANIRVAVEELIDTLCERNTEV